MIKQTSIKNWLPPIAAAILGLAIAFGAVGPLTNAYGDISCGPDGSSPCNDVLAYFALNGSTPFANRYLPDHLSVRWNSSRYVASVSISWYVYGADLVLCETNGGIYAEPVTIQINGQYAVTNGVLECNTRGSCTLRGKGSMTDGTLKNVSGPIYEAMD